MVGTLTSEEGYVIMRWEDCLFFVTHQRDEALNEDVVVWKEKGKKMFTVRG